MYKKCLLLLATLHSVWAVSSDPHGYGNRIVQARTGTFVGDYNDTYPDVRQFKYVPYAKVFD
jgi:hypothetical protein